MKTLTERDVFVDMVALRANSHLAPVADAITAMWTAIDIQRMAARTGRPTQTLVAERSAARMRLLKAIGG